MITSHCAFGKQLQCAPRQGFAGLLLGAALTLGASGFAAAQAPTATTGASQLRSRLASGWRDRKAMSRDPTSRKPT